MSTYSPEKFAQEMEKLASILKKRRDENGNYFGEESAHYMADEFMCDSLMALGYGEGVDIFERMPK